MDPNKYKSSSELEYAYKTAWALAKSATEILDWFDENVQAVEILNKKLHGEEKDKYAIGSKEVDVYS